MSPSGDKPGSEGDRLQNLLATVHVGGLPATTPTAEMANHLIGRSILARWRLDEADPFDRLQPLAERFPSIIVLQVRELAAQFQLSVPAKPTQVANRKLAKALPQADRVDQVVPVTVGDIRGCFGLFPAVVRKTGTGSGHQRVYVPVRIHSLVPSVQHHHRRRIVVLLRANRFLQSFPGRREQQLRQLRPIGQGHLRKLTRQREDDLAGVTKKFADRQQVDSRFEYRGSSSGPLRRVASHSHTGPRETFGA